MGLVSWFHGWKRANAAEHTRRRRHRPPLSARLLLERLESRITPSTDTWIASGGGNWYVASNWSTGKAPAMGEDVLIPAISGATINFSLVTANVNSITAGSNFLISGGNLTVAGSIQMTSPAVFTFSGGTLTGATIPSGQTMVLGGAFLAGTLSDVTFAAGSVLDGAQANGSGYQDLKITGGLTLNGTAKLGSAGGGVFGEWDFVGTQTLTGTGMVILGGSPNNWLEAKGPAGSTLTIDSGITIQGGSGAVTGDSDNSVVLNGTINVPAGKSLSLGLNYWPNTWVNNGTITAAGGSTVILGGTVTTAGLGNLSATGATVRVQGTLDNTGATLNLAPALGVWYLDGGTIKNGTIASTGGSTLALTSYFNSTNINEYGAGGLSGVTIAAGATIDATQYDSVAGSWPYCAITNGLTLNGTIKLGNTGGSTYGELWFAGHSQTLTGTGTVVFGNSNLNALYAGGENDNALILTVDTGITIQGGSGTIADGYSYNTPGSVVNNGTINIPSGQSLTLGASGSWVNNGTIAMASGSTIYLGGSFLYSALGNMSLSGVTVNITGTLNNVGATLTVTTGQGTWYLDGGTISGGTIASSGGAKLGLNGYSTMAGVTIAAGAIVDGTQYDSNVIVTGGLTLNGTLNLGASNGNNYANMYFRGAGTQTLTGTGVIVLGSLSGNGCWGQGDNSTHPTTLVIDTGITIQGKSGTFAGYYAASGSYAGDSVINKAAISLSGGGTLTVYGTNWSNQGTIAANGSTASLEGIYTFASVGNFTDTGGKVYLYGTLNNAGGVLALAPAMGSWYLDGSINGGIITSTGGAKLTLTASGVLSAVTIAAGTTVDGTQGGSGNPRVDIFNGLTLYGTVNLGAANGSSSGQLYFVGSQTLSGNGTIVLGNSANNLITVEGTGGGGTAATLTIGGQITIQGGAGKVAGYFSNDSIVNNGTILEANGQTLIIGGANSTNAGLIGIAGGTVKLTGTSFTNTAGGLISGHGTWTTTGVVFTNNGILDLTAPSIFNVSFNSQLTAVAVTFDASVAMNAATVTNIANYTLLGSGGDGTYGNGNDVDRSALISSITYSAPTATLQLASPLPADFYRVELNGSAVQSTSGTALLSGQLDIVNRQENDTAGQVTVSLDPASDSGVSSSDGLTNDVMPTFDVHVNQAGTISMDFESNGTYTTTLFAAAAGTYQLTAPALSDGSYSATAAFTALSGALGQSSAGYTISTVGAYVTAMSPAGTVNSSVAQATVTLNKPIDASTLSPAAITLTVPGGGTVGVTLVQLVSGNTYSITFPTQTAAGTYTLTIAPTVADRAGNALDQDQDGVNGAADDSFSGSFTIALPDLAMVQASAPSAAVEGTSVPVTWKVANLSNTNPTGATWTDAVYLSAKQTLDGTATLLTALSSSPLGPGGSYTRSTSVTIPGNVPTGSYYVLFVANANNGQLEADNGNDANDVLADAIALSAPDLQVTSLSGPATGDTGETVLFTWTDVNNGTAAATGPWFDNVYTATDAQGHSPTLLASFEFDGTLATGASVQRIQQVILPATAGTRWFMVATNANGSVSEGGGYGNDTTVAGSSISILPVPLPDLVVTSITPPANGAFSGTTVPLSFVVKNQGQAPTSKPVWQDWVILSQDATLAQTYQGQLNPTGPGGDQTLNNQPIIVGASNPSYLGVGDTYQQTVNVTLPISAQGTWYVYVVPDGTGFHHPFAMREVSRSDKLAISTGFSVTLSPPPDLAVTMVHAPAQEFSGQPTRYSWTVTNNGTGPTAAKAWTDQLYMSTKSTLDASATLLGTFAHSGVLAAGASYTNNDTVALPVGISGPFYFLVKTDVKGQVFENGATANDVAATPTTATVNLTPPPDLSVSAVAVPPTGLAGHPFTFAYTVPNAGASATPNYTWTDALYLSPTSFYSVQTAIPLSMQTHQGTLAAGASYTNTVTATVPSTVAAGPYYVLADTDSGQVVFEVNPGNNLGSSASTVAISRAPADLVVSSVSAPATALPGSAIQVNWTIANQGTGDTVVPSWQDAVYIDTGTTLSQSALLLGTYSDYGVLGPGSSYYQSEIVTLPISLLGNYHLFVVTNTTGTVQENPGNNTSAGLALAIQMQITDGQGNTQQANVADLAVTSVTASPVTGGSVTVQWTVQNVGSGTTNANYWNDDVWMSTHTTVGSGGTDVYLGTVGHTNALAAGAGYNSSGTFTLPSSFASGTYYFVVATDRPVVPPSDIGGLDAHLVYDTNLANNQGATSATTPVAPVPLPDLTLAFVSGPGSASSGRTLPVTWQVRNTGAGDTGNVTIQDSVYLSFDQVFDPNTDKYIGSATHSGNVAAGANYTQNASLPLPPGLAGTMYVFVVTNTNKNIAEANSTNDSGYAATPVQITLSPPADLVAGTVNIPASAVPGQSITLTYQVTNNGSNPANGSWTDSLYLSPAPTWSSSDPLIKQIPETQNLAAGGGFYYQTVLAPLPGVAPGTYYIILRTNIRDSFPEQNLSNNITASLTQVALDAPALTLGTATTGTLTQGQADYYKVVVSAGQTLNFTLTGQDAAASNELYVSHGTMPTRSKYDYRFSRPFQANQQITVPATQAGAYYVLVYGAGVPTPPESYAIEAAIVPFSIQAVSPGQAGAGPVTLQISGAQYAFATTFQLRSGGTTINPTRTLLQDSATAFVTFDLTNQPLGGYDLWATQADNTTTELAAGLNVVAATPQNEVQLGMVTPDVVLVGRPGTITITYTNAGNTDLPAPLLLLSSPDVQFQVPGQTSDMRSSLQLLGFNPSGPYGTLPPGFAGSITLSFTPVTAGNGIVNNFTLSALADPNQPFDWSAVTANDVPLSTPPQQWAKMVAQAQGLMGSTWGSVVSFLDSRSVQLVKNTATPVDPSAFGSLYNFDGLLQYAIGIYGLPWPGGTTPNLPVLGALGEVTLYNAHVDGAGKPIALNNSYPTFVIVPGWNGYRSDFGTLAQTIATDTDCFPNGQVNVVIATWTGATAGPPLGGIDVPWMAALHVDNAGSDLAGLLNTLNQQGKIGFGNTTIIGEGLGTYLGNDAAHILGGLGAAIALDPANPLGGYLPPSLKVYFQQSIAYETSSLFDTQLPIAASNQTLPTGDINNPLLLTTYGPTWLNGQVQIDNCDVLNPSTSTAPDALPTGNDAAMPANPTTVTITSAQVVQIQSHDPNSIIGPKGSGTNNIVPLLQTLPYTVEFTNVPTVEAPAQQVEIQETMDPNLDWSSFRLTSFGFGGLTFTVPVNSAYYQATLDLEQQLGFDVEVTATIDVVTGIATWIFTTIDPATGDVPLNPTVGLLPPDTGNGIGEGFASYTIKAKSSDATGAVVHAQATVIFDTQPPLNTAQIFNTLDSGAGLTSTVTTMPPYETTAPFSVSWAGSDALGASGVANYTVYVSDNGGPYTVWLRNTTLTSAPFTGQNGHTYRFYSVARGNDGNLQGAPTAPQTSTVVDTALPSTTAVSFPSAGTSYNVAHWTGTLSGSAADGISGVQREQVSILNTATNKYWTGSSFSSSTEVFVNATVANPGTATTTWSLAFPSSNFPGDGTYRVHAVATDTAGNVETTGQSATFSYDSTPPTTTDTLLGTTGNNGWYQSAVTVRLNASDATSGVAATYYTADGGSQQTYSGAPFAVSAQGSHHITFWSIDVAGNVASAGSDDFKIDSVAPSTDDSISGTHGAAGWYTGTGVTFTLSTNDVTSGVAAAYYTVDGGTQQAYTGSAVAVSGDAVHTIAFWSVDAAGNVETAHSDTIKIDNTNPITSDSLSGTQGNAGWYVSTVPVTLTANDVTSGVAATYYTVDGGSQQTYGGSAFTVSAPGSHHITFWSVDTAGNVESPGADDFKIDSTPPTTADGQSGTSGNAGWFLATPVTVTLSPNDATSGVVATYYAVDGGAQQTYSGPFTVSGDGTHPIRFWSVDAAGDVETAEMDSVRIDSVNPTTTDSLAGTLGTGGWYTSSAVNVTLTPADPNSGIAATYYMIDGGAAQTYGGSPFAVTKAGSHQIAFWSVDVAGNTETAGSDSFKIDNVKPITSDSVSGTHAASGWFFGASVNVTLSAADANSGVVATYYTIDGGSPQSYTGSAFTVSGDALHEITFWSVDAAGNVESAETDHIGIDNIAPTTADNLVSNSWYTTATVNVVLTAADAVSGIAATYYTVDGGSQQAYSNGSAVTGEGTHHITFWSVDTAGNAEAARSESFKIDSVKPSTHASVSGTLGGGGWYTSHSVAVTLSPSDDTSGVAATYYTIDGGSQQTYAGGSFAVSGAGVHHVTFWSVDVAGNVETTESATVLIDDVAPITTDKLTGTAGNPGWYLSSAVTVTLTPSDANSGIGTTYYAVDGGPQQTYSSTITVTSDGTHAISFWSVDTAGNVEAAETDSFHIDSIAPHTQINVSGTHGSGAWYTSGSVDVTLTATDATSGVVATYYTINSGSRQTYSGSPFTVSGDGTYQISFWSVDTAGNTESAGSQSLQIDSTAPNTTDSVAGPLSASGWYTADSVNVSLTAHDATSGALATYYTVDGGSQHTYGSAFPIAGDGAHQLTFWSVDAAGNTEPAESAIVRIDATPPVTQDALAGTFTNGWYTSATVAVTLNAADPASGIAATYYTIDRGARQTYGGSAFTVSADGPHDIAFWSVDVAGNTEAPHTESFQIDHTPPATSASVSGTLGKNGEYIGQSVSITLTAADAGSGLAGTYYRINGGSTQTYTGGPVTVTAPDDFQIAFWSVDNAGNAEAVENATFTLAAPADHLAFINGPVQLTAGGTFGLTVYAERPNGAIDQDYQGTIAVSLTSGPGKLTGTAIVPMRDGAASLSGLALSTAGTYQLLAASKTALHAAVAQFSVVAPPQFKVTVTPATIGQTGIGQPYSVTIQARQNGKAFTGYLGNVQVTTNDPQLAPQTLVFQPGDQGVKTVTVTFLTPGGRTVTAADASLSSARGTSSGVTVSGTLPPGIDHFTVTGMPATDVSGATHTVTITAVSAAGAVVTGYTGTVTLTSTDPQFQEVDNIHFTKGSGGVVHVPARLFTPGTQALTATDTSGKTGTQANIAVVSPATHLVTNLSIPTTTIAAGDEMLVNVTALTASGNVDTQFADILQLTPSDPHAVVEVFAIQNGIATFGVTFATAGPQTFALTDLTRPTIRGSVPGVTVTAAPYAAALRLTGVPLFALAGAQRITVTALDAYGNVMRTGFTDVVNVAGQSYFFTPADHGLHTFTTAKLTAGTQTLSAVDSSNSYLAAASATITVVNTNIAFTADPLDGTRTALVVVAPAGGTIAITPTAADGMTVTATMSANGKTTTSVPYAPTGHIFVYGQTGAITVREMANAQGVKVGVPALLFAGTGPSTLSAVGSSANNVLVGGPGADSLWGGAGRDILIGGGGPVILHAGTGEDVLIAGTTTYNANLAALAALLAEWGRPDRDQAHRVHDLFGDYSGGLNGQYLLNALTVTSDGGVGQLIGNPAVADWFWFAQNARAADRLTGFGSGTATFE
jgi:hypothetical protein